MLQATDPERLNEKKSSRGKCMQLPGKGNGIYFLVVRGMRAWDQDGSGGRMGGDSTRRDSWNWGAFWV